MSDLPRLATRLHSAMDSRSCAALARQAEESGYTSIWFAENPFQRGVLPAAAACALATRSIRIGIGVFNPFNRHPSLMAMEIGALDELSNGRAALGIGAGVPGWISRIVPYEKPLGAVRDATVIARGLLAGEEVTYAGKVFSADHVKLAYDLPRDRVPVYLAAMAESSLRLCGELGDGLLISNMCPPDYTRRAISYMEEGAAKASRAAPSEIVKYVPCAVGESTADAQRVILPAIGAMLSGFWDAYRTSPGARSAIGDDNGIEPEAFAAALHRLAEGEAAPDVLDDRFVAAYGVAGTLDACIDQCRSLRASGVTELTLTFLGDDPVGDMKRFGEAVADG